MNRIKIINERNGVEFEEKVNEFLEKGYKVNSSSCNIINKEEYNFQKLFMAILVKETNLNSK